MATPTTQDPSSAAQSLDPALASLVADNKYIINIIEHGPYGYTPSLYLPIAFAALYGLSAMLHVAQMANTRHWYMAILVFGCVAEAAGNNIRIWGHFKPLDITPYIAQQVILVVTPAFFAAVHYWVLGRILALFGCGFTLASISPKNIAPLFIVLDVASLGIQAAGSAIAAIAEVDSKDTTSGGNIVVIGLCVQLAAYFCFNLLLLSFIWKAAFSSTTNQNPYWTRRFKWFLLGLFLASVLVLCRSVFRTIEMIGGWVGPISTVEWYYFAFDAAPVCASVILLNLFHPGYVLPENHSEAVQQGCIRRNEVDGATTAKAIGKQKESKKGKGKKGARPRSSFLVGGPADMNNVSVLSSGRDNLHRTQPHFRTGSLASTSIDKDGYSPDTDKGSFGWSQPQSPAAVAYAQFRARTHPTVADHFAENAMTSMDGFDPVNTSPRGFKDDDEDGSSMMMMAPMRSTSAEKLKDERSLTPSVYSQPSRGPSMATPLPEVQVWRDGGDGEATPIRSSTLDPDRPSSSSDWTISAASPTSASSTVRGPSQDTVSPGGPGLRQEASSSRSLHAHSSPADAPYQGYAVQPQQPDYRNSGVHPAASTSVQMMQASPSSSTVGTHVTAPLPIDTPSRQFREEAAAAAAFASSPSGTSLGSPPRRQADQPYRDGVEVSSVLSIGDYQGGAGTGAGAGAGHTQLVVEPLRFHQQQQQQQQAGAGVGAGAPASSRDQRRSNVSEYAYAL